MKKIFIAFLLAAGTLFWSGCDSLDLGPIDYYGTGNFWSNAAQVEAYSVGIHNQLRSSYQMFYVMGEARGGTLRLGVSSVNTSMDMEAPIKNNTFTKDNTGISNWYGIYSRLLQVNHMIDKLETACEFLSDSERGHYLGQAYGIRALYYFMLYRTYGGVPLETEVKVMGGKIDVNELYMARSSAEETLQLIKNDINQSETNFAKSPAVNDCYYWSANATQFLKAQVYLWSAKVTTDNHTAGGTADLNTAKAALNTLIGKYQLQSDFSKVFTSKKNNEIIFSLFFDKDEATNWGNLFMYEIALFEGTAKDKDGNIYSKDPLGLINGGTLRHEWKETFVRSFDEADTRRAGTFFVYYVGPSAPYTMGCVIKKLLGSVSDGSRKWDSDVIVMRYADVLLMMAEVENGLNNDPSPYINQVRSRAYGGNHPVYSRGSYGQNERAILTERNKEFVAEGCRWFDLVRMQDDAKKALVFAADVNFANIPGDAPAPVLTEAQKYMILWPIDKTVLNADPLLADAQNPGY